jgi:FMN-dependent NADH-azoreductase
LISASETPQAPDHQESYLRTVPNFRGITNVTIVGTEDLRLSEQRPARASTQVQAEIERLAPRAAA